MEQFRVIQNAVEHWDPQKVPDALKEIDLSLGSTSDANGRVFLFFSKASCYEILGRFEEAREQLSLALQERPEDINTRLAFEYHSAIFCQEEQKFGEALERLTAMVSDHVQELGRPDQRWLYEQVQQRRAFLSVTLSRFPDAIPLLREALTFDLEKEVRSEVLDRLGLCYLHLKEWESARDYFIQAGALGLSSEAEKTYHFYLGIAYFYTDAFSEAKREFELCETRLAEYQLPVVDLYGWLAAVCRLLGETEKSARYARLARPN